MTKYNANHAVTFHSRIQAAKEFKVRHEIMYPNLKSLHVNGGQSSSERALSVRNDVAYVNYAASWRASIDFSLMGFR